MEDAEVGMMMSRRNKQYCTWQDGKKVELQRGGVDWVLELKLK